MTILVELGRKGSSFPLFVPLIHPGDRTDSLEVLEEKLAGTILLSFQVLTTVEVDIVLPAVPEERSRSLTQPGKFPAGTTHLVWFWFGNLGS